MAEYKTKYAIGDLVYIADENKVDRDVVKAIKIRGIKGNILYGIEARKGGMSWCFYPSDEYSWYKTSEVFTEREGAVALHENLKAKADAEEAKEKADMDKERKADLLKELKELDDV